MSLNLNRNCTFLYYVCLCTVISKCRESIPITRIIQKSVRHIVSQNLSKVIDQVVLKNDLFSWLRLLAFPYIVFRFNGKKQDGQNIIRSNLAEFNQISDVSKFLSELLKSSVPKPRNNFSSEEQLIRIATRKVSEGDFSSAVRILCSTEVIAETNEDTFLKLKGKHPSEHIPVIDIPPDIESLPNTTILELTKAISRFKNSSAGGIDGLRPRHIKDLTSYSCGDAALKLKVSIANLVDLIKSGNIPSELLKIFYGAQLTALQKLNKDIRPLAVGLYWRRLAGKITCYNIRESLSNNLYPKQIGFAVNGGAEAMVHSVRAFIEHPHSGPMVLLKIDYRNAFNEAKRQHLLNETKKHCPSVLKMFKQAYGQHSNLYYNHGTILSESGVQQGCPLGPPGFCIAIKKLIDFLSSKFNGWYLDDGNIGGSLDTILTDINKIIDYGQESGLVLNPSKCEVFIFNCTDEQKVLMHNQISNLLPGVRLIDEMDLLGAPISNTLISSFLLKKKECVKLMCDRLMKLDIHPALCLLRSCISTPKFIYLLRSCPSFQYPDCLSQIDELFRSTLENICNTRMNGTIWKQASLPLIYGGIGIRKTADLAVPAYFSSLYKSRDISNDILKNFEIDIFTENITQILQSLDNIPDNEESKKVQKEWDKLTAKKAFEDLMLSENLNDRARLLASSQAESSKWLQVIPSPQLGLFMDNNTIRIAIALHLGSHICERHSCRCGKIVEPNGYHSLSCKYSAGRLPRHVIFNKILSQSLRTAGHPNILEPPGMCRSDGKRADGVTIAPWFRGKALLWDATIGDTLAPSYLQYSSKTPGFVADKAERKKHNYYIELKKNYYFTPVSFETLGTMGPETKKFINTIGKDLQVATGEPRAKEYLLQRLSVELQRANAASILNTSKHVDESTDEFYKIFDIL